MQTFTGANPVNRYNSGGALRNDLAALIAGMRQGMIDNQDVVYRIELAGHGFVVVIRRQDGNYQAELLECLAHCTSLTQSLMFAPKTPDGVIGALQAMLSDDMNQRVAGAHYMGWNAHGLWLGNPQGNDPVFPNIAFRWWAALLEAGAGQRWVNQFLQRLTFLENH